MIPKPTHPLVTPKGTIDPVWFRWFLGLTTPTATTAAPAPVQTLGDVIGLNGITVVGDLETGLKIRLTGGVSNLSGIDLSGLADGDTLVWNEADGVWRSGPAGVQTTVSDTAPVDPVNGQGWVDTTDGTFYIWYDDGTSAAWVAFGSAGGSTPPTGTGFRHVIAGVEDAAAKLVDTADVNNDAITYAKMQNVSATDKLLGRATAGAGDVEEITCTPFARTLLDDTTAGAARATLGVTPGDSIFSLLKKTANQTRSSTTTLADDSQLVVALSASTGYTIRGKIFYQVANATMDFKLAPAYSGTTTTILYHRSIFGAGASPASEIANTTASFGTFTPDSPAAGVGCITFDLYLMTNSAGNFSIQWAQNVSDAGNATLLAGSYIEYAIF